MKTARFCFMAALLAASGAAQAAAQTPRIAAGAMPVAFTESDFQLAPGSAYPEIVVTGVRFRPFSPESRRAREATGALFHDGEIEYVDPVWYYRRAADGPAVEFAVLGGGMVNAPYFVHVGVNWLFR